MKRKQSRKGRPVVFVELSKEGSVLVDLAANFLMMSKLAFIYNYATKYFELGKC